VIPFSIVCSAIIFAAEFGSATLDRYFESDISLSMELSYVHGQGPFAFENTIVGDTYLGSCHVSERCAFLA
jgi:hypothetical protein